MATRKNSTFTDRRALAHPRRSLGQTARCGCDPVRVTSWTVSQFCDTCDSPQQSTVHNSPQQSATVRDSSATVRNSPQQSATPAICRNSPRQPAIVCDSPQGSATPAIVRDRSRQIATVHNGPRHLRSVATDRDRSRRSATARKSRAKPR